MLLFCCSLIVAIGPFTGLVFLSHSLVAAIVYVWARARENRNRNIYVLFVIRVKAPYLPLTFLIMRFLMNGLSFDDIVCFHSPFFFGASQALHRLVTSLVMRTSSFGLLTRLGGLIIVTCLL